MKENELTERLLSTNALNLIPESAKLAAHNPTNLEVFPVRESTKELNFILVEHNVPGLTSEKSWDEWMSAIQKADQEQAESFIKIIPDPPDNINRLHVISRTLIESRKLSITDRILLTCKLTIKKAAGINMLFVGDYDGEIGLGIATDFYKETLPKLAEELGLRFILGQSSGKNVDYFIKKLGRFTYGQLKKEWQAKLFPELTPMSGQFITIQFLYSEDIDKYIDKK